ncbi:MAG: CmcI family methyltransferase [Gaiellaceae bacterium]
MSVPEFHKLYYESRQRTWKNTFWLGYSAEKCPLDLWIYQEILFETRPDVVIETGTAAGGSALFLATIFDVLGSGIVVTIDIDEVPSRPVHPRVEYVVGSSTEETTVERVRTFVRPGLGVMAILDSDHSKDHVLGELRHYGELVTPGKYLVVEDTNVNGHPVRPDFGPGPMEAVEEFLAENEAFEIDPEREKFFMTFNPGGYLIRRR